MTREELFMDILGDLDGRFVTEALPKTAETGLKTYSRRVTLTEPKPVDPKALGRYRVIRAVMASAAVVVLIAAIALLDGSGFVRRLIDSYAPASVTANDSLPDISEAYGKLTEFSDADVRISKVSYDGTRLNTTFYLLYKGNDGFYSPALWLNIEGAEHGDPSCSINPVMEADSYDYLIQSSVPVVLEPGKSYAVNIEYLGSGNRESDTQKYRFTCPDIPVVTAATTTNNPYLTSAVEPLIEPDEADRFEQITDTSMPEPFDSMEYPLGNFDFYSLWQAKLFGADQIVHFDYEKQNEYRKRVEGIETPYTLYDSPNFYGMARIMRLTDDEITEATKTINEHFENSTNLLNNTSYIYTEEDIAVIKNADDSAAAQHFASEYSIVVGEYAFCPKWLYYHTIEDYKSVGITPEEVLHKLDMYEGLGLTDEARAAFSAKLQKYIGNDLPIAEFDYDDMKLVVTKYEFDGSTMNIYYDVVFSENLGAENERMKSEIPNLTFLIFSEYRQKIDTVSESENSLSMVRTITIDEPQDSVAVQCFPITYTGQISQELWDKYTFTAVKNMENVEPALKWLAMADKTFDIKYYIRFDLAGMAAGYAMPFDGRVADGTAFKTIKSSDAPIPYLYSTNGFFKESHDLLPDDLMEILKKYADGDDLKPDLGGDLPPLSSYTLLDDTDLLESYGTKTYRVSSDYIVLVAQRSQSYRAYNVIFLRRNDEYTKVRKAVELLWKNYGSLPPFDVFAAEETDGNEYLMIVADDSVSLSGERTDALSQIKKLLEENELADSSIIKLTTPQELRGTWTPIRICTEDSTEDITAEYDSFCVRYGGDVYVKADGEFSTPKEVADKLDELGRTNAAKAMRGEIGVDNVGDGTRAESELFDLVNISGNSNTNFGKLYDVLIGRSPDSYSIYQYHPELSDAVLSAKLLRGLTSDLRHNIDSIDLVIGGDPVNDPESAEYTIRIHTEKQYLEPVREFVESLFGSLSGSRKVPFEIVGSE